MMQLNGVLAKYQENVVFHDLQLQFHSNVSYLITGKNGTGKTTLLKLLAGIIQPGKGFVTYDFIDKQADWDEKYRLRKKHIHYIPCHPLHELMNAPDLFYQQRYYTIEATPLPTVRDYLGERVEETRNVQLPDAFQLHHLLDLELVRLSNGQVKKLIILKQLLDSIPSVLILDYPFEGLDAQSRLELRDFLDQLVAQHHIQLIIADQVHPQLPKAITKKIELGHSTVLISDFLCDTVSDLNIPMHNLPLQMNEKEEIVEMQEVKIQYGEKVIFDHLNWKIHRGERWALTGRNGSGKTTLFSMIYADHPKAYSEKVFLFGKRRGSGESIWDIKKRISYLGPEHMHFFDSVTENLTVRSYLVRAKAGANKLDHLISFFQLHDFLARQLRQLSQGQLQLVLLVSMFLSQKELLLLDEPFQFLDHEQKMRVSEYLETHMDESVTLVLITHYDQDVARWTNHRLML